MARKVLEFLGFWRLGQENLGIFGILVTWPGKSWDSWNSWDSGDLAGTILEFLGFWGLGQDNLGILGISGIFGVFPPRTNPKDTQTRPPPTKKKVPNFGTFLGGCKSQKVSCDEFDSCLSLRLVLGGGGGGYHIFIYVYIYIYIYIYTYI